jgi:hypothetical protein
LKPPTRVPTPGRIVSGGQTGVDRAALAVAVALGLECGGWSPAGRTAEDGPIPDRYPLRETPSADPAERTRWNVRDSDATLVLVRGEPEGGTLVAVREAQRLRKPHLVVQLADPARKDRIREWLMLWRPMVLNVAGPRESEAPGIYAEALRVLGAVLGKG